MLDRRVSSLTFELFSSWEITGGRFFIKLPFVETSWMQAFTARLVCSEVTTRWQIQDLEDSWKSEQQS